MRTLSKNLMLFIEFLILFFGIPLFLFLDKALIHPSILLIPVVVALIFYFRRNKEFKLKDLVQLNISKKTWLIQILLVVIVGLLLVLSVFIFDRENLFNLPKRNPAVWIGMLFFYPIFSAYGQEIVYRKFLFMRYQNLFQSKWLLVLASAISFSFVHIVYFNVLSIILTLFAGIYLALLYENTKSVLFTAIIHGIVGFLIFTVGLGQHFWLDMMDYL